MKASAVKMSTVTVKIYNPMDNITYQLNLSPEDAARLTTDERFAISVLNHAVSYKKNRDRIKEAQNSDTAGNSKVVNRGTGKNSDSIKETIHQSQHGSEETGNHPQTIEQQEAGENSEPVEEEICYNSEDVEKVNESESILTEIEDSQLADEASRDVEDELRDKHNWQYNETKALISSYNLHKAEFKHPKKRKFAWQNIANDLVSAKYHVTAELCHSKWKNLMRSYKTRVDGDKATGTAPSRFQFFDLMHDVIGNMPSMSCPHALASMDDQDSTASQDSIKISERKINKNKSTRISEVERQQKRHDDKMAIQKERYELKQKLHDEKFALKKIILEETAASKLTQQKAQETLQENRQNFKLRLQREQFAAKEKLMNQKSEFEAKKIKLEMSKMDILKQYLETKSRRDD